MLYKYNSGFVERLFIERRTQFLLIKPIRNACFSLLTQYTKFISCWQTCRLLINNRDKSERLFIPCRLSGLVACVFTSGGNSQLELII